MRNQRERKGGGIGVRKNEIGDKMRRQEGKEEDERRGRKGEQIPTLQHIDRMLDTLLLSLGLALYVS